MSGSSSDAGGAAAPPPPGPAPSSGPPMRLVVAAGLHGAFLLARGRREGLVFVEGTPAGARRSFWAAAICLPAYLALQLFAWAAEGAPPGGPGRGVAVALIGNVCAWAGFALASRILAEAMGRVAAWPRYIAAWNWTGVVQHLVLLLAAAPGAVGMPALVAQASGVAALGYALWLEWFVARGALGIRGADAAGFVLLDLALGLFLHGLGRHLGGV
ncbi:hypothetical protein [Caldovatus aquaticus]|uniref:Yip1 domain-containing protein n=1 Tax=Caldovatus aquaticus TaxID=2865671 RepID=A0ABS7F060_9PROT|nr:hypothetical protein [Caldovatus aquaticus]MBW8269007.1 hypothetical protein [Caldovatus aquaticus]